jgi:hypothetical protein
VAKYPSYTSCCQPGTYQAVPWVAISVFGGGGVAGLLYAILGIFLSFPQPGIAACLAGIGLCAAGIALCLWWLNIRLICLGGDRSATGAIYSLEPFSFSNDIFDTDYSFNLLLWGFIPQNVLPLSFVNDEWSGTAFNQLATEWPTQLQPLVPNIPWANVSDLVTLIAAQPSIAQDEAKSNWPFGGQNVDPDDQVALPGGSDQHFVLHCEIEGPGMRNLLALLIGLLAMFVAATIVYAIPGIGWIISLIIVAVALLLAALGAHSIINSPTSPPAGGGFGGSLNPYRPGDDPNQPVDLAYVLGRWVCDSGFMHNGGNELHPVYLMCRIGGTTQGQIKNGNWPDPGDCQTKLDAFFKYINSPAAGALQQQPENQWTIHPLLDGCVGTTPYPVPSPPGVIV